MAILGQVWYDNRMGISPRSLGISLGFRDRCERHLLMGISPKSLGISLCLEDLWDVSDLPENHIRVP